jgi:hypothetical protein
MSMAPKKALWAAILLGSTLPGLGCSGASPVIRIQGVAVPSGWVEGAEHPGTAGSGPTQAQLCLALSRKIWERDGLESLRYLRRGAFLRDADCCRQYLVHAEESSVNQSQRAYARFFVEGLLRRGPILGSNGEDIRAELYEQLALAWLTTEPCSAGKARQVLESLLDLAPQPERMPSPSLVRLLRELGLRPIGGVRAPASAGEVQLYAGEQADEPRRWLRIPSTPLARQSADWIASEASAWGGGSDRLLQNATVLAFLVNEKGEPCFRGTQLWICNLGDSSVTLNSLPVGQCNRELVPGREELLPLVGSPFVKAEATTGIPLVVHHHRILR